MQPRAESPFSSLTAGAFPRTAERGGAPAPERADEWHRLGLIAYRDGRLRLAADHLCRAAELCPANADYCNNLGVVLTALGRREDALACCRRAVDLRPLSAASHYNLANALRSGARPDEAIASYRRALELKPDLAEAYGNLGAVLLDQGRTAEAVGCCRRALALEPGHADAHNNLGAALEHHGSLAEAIACYHRALALDPRSADAHASLGSALQHQGRLDDAVACYRQSLRLDPDCAAAHKNLASALHEQGEADEASASCRRAMELEPRDPRVHSRYLSTLAYRGGVALADLARAHAEYERRHAAPLRAAWRPHANARDPHRRLRLGFLSPDLGRHPVGRFLAPVLENLDRRECEIVCYSDRLAADDLTARLRRAADLWLDVFRLTDEALSERIGADRVDVLFDLAGHTIGNRLPVFARKPAPLQITWLGYPGTTGLSAIDYILADAREIPPEAEPGYREAVLRLPDGYACFDPPATAPPVAPLPALAAGHVTFGSFNNLAKITPRVVATWSEILRRVPKSRLTLRFKGLESPTVRARLLDQFSRHAVASERIEFVGWGAQYEVFELYNRVDLALDPFPYGGGLTTCEALWMGVPVVTFPGPTFAGRHALSHLASAGLTETIARDRDDYVDLAARLAGDVPLLASVRAGLRRQVAESPLCNAKRFADNLMAVVRGAWRDWATS